MSIEINREKLKRAVKRAVKVGSATLLGISAFGGSITPAEGSSGLQ